MTENLMKRRRKRRLTRLCPVACVSTSTLSLSPCACVHVRVCVFAGTLFELELPKHISELRGLGEALDRHLEIARSGFAWRLTQCLASSTQRRIKSFSQFLDQAMGISKALRLRLVVHDFAQWNARAATHLVSGSPLDKVHLVTFRLRKLAIPDRLTRDLDAIEEEARAVAEFLPQDDDAFEEYLDRCRDCADRSDPSDPSHPIPLSHSHSHPPTCSRTLHPLARARSIHCSNRHFAALDL